MNDNRANTNADVASVIATDGIMCETTKPIDTWGKQLWYETNKLNSLSKIALHEGKALNRPLHAGRDVTIEKETSHTLFLFGRIHIDLQDAWDHAGRPSVRS